MALIGTTMRSPRVDLRKSPSPTLVFGGMAVVGALVGLFLLVQTALTTTPLVGLNTEARGETLSMWVSDVEMLDHSASAGDGGVEDDSAAAAGDQIDIPGFDMPASMMPGSPIDGFQRLQFELDFMNRKGGLATVAPVDFYLVADDGEIWNPLLGGTFEGAELGSQQVLNTIIAFDIPDTVSSPELQLVWTGDGKEVHFSVDAGGH